MLQVQRHAAPPSGQVAVGIDRTGVNGGALRGYIDNAVEGDGDQVIFFKLISAFAVRAEACLNRKVAAGEAGFVQLTRRRLLQRHSAVPTEGHDPVTAHIDDLRIHQQLTGIRIYGNGSWRLRQTAHAGLVGGESKLRFKVARRAMALSIKKIGVRVNISRARAQPGQQHETHACLAFHFFEHKYSSYFNFRLRKHWLTGCLCRPCPGDESVVSGSGSTFCLTSDWFKKLPARYVESNVKTGVYCPVYGKQNRSNKAWRAGGANARSWRRVTLKLNTSFGRFVN
ncbi:hypothetical protein HCH_03975 [Hahella chejuensis KCTC 2396]|uniref:Uncharacterized protein n=1 Tax=Hahella chejuensis (strain KCTC 2396) TaxID=349521 RepID=Q2SF80_HAHCH|nr:hypothetical protein HCH_03975 [Hahella chejuensis KCTC 2396]